MSEIGSSDANASTTEEYGSSTNSDDTPDPAEQRRWLAEWIEEFEIDARDARYIDVRDGEKGTRTPGHQEPENWFAPDDDALTGNYGVHSGYGLLELDVDDHDEWEEMDMADRIPDDVAVLRVVTPHTPEGEIGHRYLPVADETGAKTALNGAHATLNPEPDWGEVKYGGKYVVGPGSQLDGCTKEWCDECAEPDAGYYEIKSKRDGRGLTADEVREIARIGPDRGGETGDTTPEQGGGQAATADADGGGGYAPDEHDGERPACYEAALRAREDPDDATVNQFKINTDAALLGLHCHGYDADDVVGEFEEFAPPQGFDRDTTEEHVERLRKKARPDADNRQRPPSAETLAEHGILAEAGCPDPECAIHDETADDTATEQETSGGEGDTGLPTPTAFSVLDGRYGVWSGSSDDRTFDPFASFQLEARSFLRDGETEQVEMTVHPATAGDSYDVTVPFTVFNDVRTFKDEVLTRRGTTFNGGFGHLNKLRLFVAEQDAVEREGTDHLGLHEGEWTTPNGSIDEDGWVDEPETVFTGPETSIREKWSVDPDDGDGYDRDEVAEILRLLPKTRDSDRFLPALGWFYAAPVRPYIMDWEGGFNLLNVLGDTEAGKTSTLSVLWRLFGMDREPLSAGGTNYPKMTAMASSNALPVWFDEYKPADMKIGRLKSFHSYLRKTTRGGVEQRGNPDGSVDRYPLRAPVCVSGEQPIKGPAEERRSILTTFRRTATDPDTETYRAFARLSGGSYRDPDTDEMEYCDGCDLGQHAIAYYRWLLGRDPDDLRDEWRAAGEHVVDLLGDHDIDGLTELGVQGLQTVRFGSILYREFCEHVGVDPDQTGVREESIDDATLYVADAGNGGEQSSHVDRLVGLFARAAAAGYLEEGEHYRFVEPQDGGEQLRVDLVPTFDQVRRFARDHDVQGDDLLQSAEDYRPRLRDDADNPDSVVAGASIKTRELGRAVGFDVERATDQIRGFSPAMFDGYEGDGGGASGQQPTPLVRVTWEDDAPNPDAVTVKCTEADAHPSSGKKAFEATVRDRSRTGIGVIAWDSNPPDSGHLVGGECYLIERAVFGRDHEGRKQITLDSRTEITPIQRGVGFTGDADSGGNRTLEEIKADTPDVERFDGEDGDNEGGGGGSSGDEPRGGDGETTPQGERRDMIHKNATTAVDRDTLTEYLVDDCGLERDAVEHDVDEMLRKGELRRTVDGEIESTGKGTTETF